MRSFSASSMCAALTAFNERSVEKMGQSVPNTIFSELNIAEAISMARGPKEEQSTWMRLAFELGNIAFGVRVMLTLSIRSTTIGRVPPKFATCSEMSG